MADKFNYIGNGLRKCGNHEKAIETYLKCYEIQNEISDKNTVMKCLINLGKVNDYLGNFEKALNYYNKCLSIKS